MVRVLKTQSVQSIGYILESDGIKKSESEEIQKVMKRIDRNYDYYSTNPMIKGTFDFLKMVVDNWFKTV